MNLNTVLKELCFSAGVNGIDDASKIAERYLSQYTQDIHRDRLGNVWGFSPSVPNAPTVLLEAHIDEIGFTVSFIDEQGFLHLSACGGVDNRTLSGASVTVLTQPPINGLFCAVPPHLSQKDEKTLPELSERGVDVGMTNEEATARIPLGTRAVFTPHFENLLNDTVCSKALDNRAGVAAVLQALEYLKDKELPVRLAVAFCVQEELGLRGSRTTAFSIRPDAAISVDVSFAHTPDADKRECGVLGKGVMLGISPALDNNITHVLRQLAHENNIPHQYEVMGDSTGTDADVIGITAEGIPTGLLSIPLRYMHTPVEVVSLHDIDATAKLLAAFVLKGGVCADD